MRHIKTNTRERKALHQAFLRFLAIPVILAILSSVLIGYTEYHKRLHEILDLQHEQVIAAMIAYRNSISYMTAIARTIEADYADIAGNENPTDALESLYKYNLRQYPIIDSLRTLNLDGMETLRVNRDGDTAYVVPAEDLQDLSGWFYYQEATRLERYQFLFSNLDLDMEHGEIVLDPATGLSKPMLRICSPLDVDGARAGYFMVSFLMRNYLDTLRTSLQQEGCYVLLMDENGYLYNTADDQSNFGFMYETQSAGPSTTIASYIQAMDITKESGSFILDTQCCSFASYQNIYDRSADYLLSSTAPVRLIFMVCYDEQSIYTNDLHYSYIYHLVRSWKTQLPVWGIVFLLYLVLLFLIFNYDRLRFTNLFSDNRYPKATLKQALKSHQFANYYQPIINIQDGTVLGFEALSRWIYQDQLLPPSMFIDEIFHYQLGQTLDENVFLTVRKDRKRMEQYPEFRNTFISINCCQQTFNSLIMEPPDTIIRLTEEEKQYIVLELLEDIVFNQTTQKRIKEMYQHNILFAIDDFGTGNSNIAFIRSFENLKVKIDRTFVPVDTANLKDRIILEAFVKMFVDQGLKLIVEGVESREQIHYLKTLGIAGVQGYYFSHPMTIDELILFIKKKDYLKKL